MFGWLKDALYLTKREKQGLIILSVLSFALILINIFLPQIVGSSSKLTKQELAAFKAWVNENKVSDQPNKNLEPPEYKTLLFPFNPDTISRKGLQKLGLSNFAIQNFLKYRSSGGEFNSSNDVKKIYGIDSSLFTSLKPFIEIIDKKKIPSVEQNLTYEKSLKQSPKQKFEPEKFVVVFDEKLSENELESFGFNSFVARNIMKYKLKGGSFRSLKDLKSVYGIDTNWVNDHKNWFVFPELNIKNISIELNTADSAQLTQLNGIGPYYAKMIIKYRSILGGYSQIEQLNEVYGMGDFDLSSLKSSIEINRSKIEKLELKKENFKLILKHPYMDYYNTKELFNLLEQKGEKLTKKDILNHKLLDPKVSKKIIPYLHLKN